MRLIRASYDDYPGTYVSTPVAAVSVTRLNMFCMSLIKPTTAALQGARGGYLEWIAAAPPAQQCRTSNRPPSFLKDWRCDGDLMPRDVAPGA